MWTTNGAVRHPVTGATGGSGIIAALSGSDPVRGRALQVPPPPGVHRRDPPGQLGVEVGRGRERPPGQERSLQVVMEPLDQAFRLRVARAANIHPGRQRATERLALRGQLLRPRHRPTAPSPSHTSVRGTAPSARSLPPAREQVLRVPRGTSSADAHREYPDTIVSTGSCFAVRTCPNPTGTCTGGNQKSSCAISPAAYARPRRRIRRQVRRPQLRDPPASVRIRIRPPDPLRDHRRRHRRERPQQLPDPRLEPIRHRPRRARAYRGGPSDRSAARTVFREIVHAPGRSA